ncbi:hypothetical protein Mlute_02533 [Meiothermus luteus]|uniref:Uncharacterized protein n=1 Tax=Meiothermus luteus TaxID=2026184 RepID=A0A399EEG3_9DEIN|nr:hypothetical protein [Meiothermus luteus]RIH82298.1 hypothetical protein Mlute_02533 [Meiothermus luteus]
MSLFIAISLVPTPLPLQLALAFLVYLLGFCLDAITTRWAVVRYGPEVESNSIARYFFRRFGFWWGLFLAAVLSISMGMGGGLVFLLLGQDPDYFIVGFGFMSSEHLGAGLSNLYFIRWLKVLDPSEGNRTPLI